MRPTGEPSRQASSTVEPGGAHDDVHAVLDAPRDVLGGERRVREVDEDVDARPPSASASASVEIAAAEHVRDVATPAADAGSTAAAEVRSSAASDGAADLAAHLAGGAERPRRGSRERTPRSASARTARAP